MFSYSKSKGECLSGPQLHPRPRTRYHIIAIPTPSLSPRTYPWMYGCVESGAFNPPRITSTASRRILCASPISKSRNHPRPFNKRRRTRGSDRFTHTPTSSSLFKLSLTGASAGYETTRSFTFFRSGGARLSQRATVERRIRLPREENKVPRLTRRRTHAGLFAGLSLEGTVLIERKDANKDFYGSAVPARDILSGRVPPPEVASKLYEVIEAAEGIDESGLPESAYVPTAAGDHMDIRHGGTVFDAEGH